jgi:hypothetical protein
LATIGQVTVTPGALASALTGSRLEARRQLDTGPSASAELLLTCKATLAVQELTTLSVEPPAVVADGSVERVVLERGRLLVSVPKLLPGHRLVIETPDATVTVHGTRFSVSVEGGLAGRTITRVFVSEGRVEVASAGHSEFLTPGRDWSSTGVVVAASTVVVPASPVASSLAVVPSAPAPALASASASASAVVAAERTGRDDAAPARESSSALRVPRASLDSELAEENRIFTRALQSARAGDTSGALADLDELIQKHPRSPLMQSVRVEHFRLLHQAGNVAAAAREARAYLSAFPTGFARSEARRFALLDVADSP